MDIKPAGNVQETPRSPGGTSQEHPKDEIEIARFGKKQRFNRRFRTISIIGLVCTLMATWETILMYVHLCVCVALSLTSSKRSPSISYQWRPARCCVWFPLRLGWSVLASPGIGRTRVYVRINRLTQRILSAADPRQDATCWWRVQLVSSLACVSQKLGLLWPFDDASLLLHLASVNISKGSLYLRHRRARSF